MKFLFIVRIERGNTKIIPDGAEVTAELKFKKGEVEEPITNGICQKMLEIYVLGSAVIDDIEGDKLAVSDGKINFRSSFLMNPKLRLCSGRGRKGLLGLGVAQNATVFLGLVLFGAVGSFAATDFLWPPCLLPIFLSFSMFVLMYNDLIFLQNRVKGLGKY